MVMGWRDIGILINTYLEKLMFLWVLSSMGIGYLLHTFLSYGQASVVWLFACMTFVTALGTQFKQIAYVVRHPWRILLVIVLIHLLLPYIAFGLGSVFLSSNPQYIVGIVLASSIPVGVTSVMWTGLANGALPIALSIVALDTLLSPVILPYTVRLIVGQTVNINFGELFWGLMFMVVLPTLVGIVINELSKGQMKGWIHPIASPFSKLAMLAVVAINVAIVTPSLNGQHHVVVLLCVLVSMAVLGYVIGHLSGLSSRADGPTQISMTYNVGMRNISAGITIATQYFSHEASIPVVLAMLFQQPLATLVCWLYQRKQRMAFMDEAHDVTQ